MKRRLWLYRGLSLVLALSLAGLLFVLRRAMADAPEPDVEVIDVPARFEALARSRPDAADIAETYFFGDAATVHLHVMGNGQTCPLHIHRRTSEATVIVAGQAEVKQVWGEGDGLAQREGTHGPGELIASEPFTGHEWRNRALDAMLGNLVFGTPRFDGNLYVAADDARLKQGTPPFTHDPELALVTFAGQGGHVREEPLPVLQGHMSSLLLDGGAQELVGSRDAPVVVYVARGAGTMEVPEARGVREGQLWVLRREARVRAEAGTPLALYVFRPPPGAPRS